MKAHLFLFLLVFVLVACSQNVKTKVLPSSSTLVLLGYDSVGFYSTSFPQLSSISKGKLHDSTFISKIIDSLKRYIINKNYLIIIKPTASGDVASDFKYFVNVLNNNNVENRRIDTLSTQEQMLFNTRSIPNIFGEPTSMKLNLPKEENTADVVNINKDKSITLILGKDNVIYAYKGKISSSVKKLSYESVRAYIIENQKTFNSKDFTIIIKPSDGANYKNTIDILDEMSINTIKKYVLVDISKEDIALIESLN